MAQDINWLCPSQERSRGTWRFENRSGAGQWVTCNYYSQSLHDLPLTHRLLLQGQRGLCCFSIKTLPLPTVEQQVQGWSFSEGKEEVEVDGHGCVLEPERQERREAAWVRTCSRLFEVLGSSYSGWQAGTEIWNFPTASPCAD